LIFVAGGYQLFEPQMLKAVCEVMKERADARVVAVAIDDFASEVAFVMSQFVRDVVELRIELVLFRLSRPAESQVLRYTIHHTTIIAPFCRVASDFWKFGEYPGF